ncbi:cation acetate symporter [Kitasatospora phosalacinea]|uniref:Cation acetate symporter n=1 Tax=Kitasatospora phosalacinea TaxID=2065 RepID=A0ABW6GWA8_9ACTN
MNALADAATVPGPLPVVLMVFLGLCGFLWLFTGSGEDDAAMFPGPDRPAGALRSGLAISGDSLTSVTLMLLVGLIAFTGYDGVMFSLGCVTGIVLLALLVAEPLRRTGGHTVGDALARRFPVRAVRTGTALVTLCVCLPYLVLQLTVVGSVTGYALGLSSATTRTVGILVVGVLMLSLAVTGGARGTARVQAVKVVVLLVTFTVLAVLALHRVGWNPERLLGTAAAHSPLGDAFFGPGPQYGPGASGAANRLGQFVTLALAVSCMPQVTMRVLTAPPGRAVRTAAHWAVAQILLVSALIVTVGIGAAALLDTTALHAADPTGGSALFRLADVLSPGGGLVSVVFCAVLLTVLATVADVTLAAATTVARDLFPRTAEPGGAPGRRQERLARRAAALIGTAAIALAVQAADWNLLVLSTFAMTLAASALGPVLLYGLLWPRFTARGALWCLYSATAAVTVLVVFSPLLSGSPGAVLPDRDFSWTPLSNPGLVSVPVGFALGWLGSVSEGRATAPHDHARPSPGRTSHPAPPASAPSAPGPWPTSARVNSTTLPADRPTRAPHQGRTAPKGKPRRG